MTTDSLRACDLKDEHTHSTVTFTLNDGTAVEGVLLDPDLDRPSAFDRPDRCWPLVSVKGRARLFGLYRDHPVELVR